MHTKIWHTDGETWFASGEECNAYGARAGTPEDLGPPQCPAANPVNPATGNKYQEETDYIGQGRFPLRWKRYYNSDAKVEAGSFGTHWRSEFDRSIRWSGPFPPAAIEVSRFDGHRESFAAGAVGWVGEADSTLRVDGVHDPTGALTGWTVIRPDESRETYDAAGLLVRVEKEGQQTHSLQYDTDQRLSGVFDADGRSLDLTRNAAGLVSRVVGPDGFEARYSYDAESRLIAVAYADQTPGDWTDNPTRQYLYENLQFYDALTGIVDENGNRYATWTYDAQGRAISSEHAGGADRTTLAYNPDGTTTVTNALGKQSTMHFASVLGARRLTDVVGHPTASCAAANQAYSYDANGFLASSTDWNGNLTTYLHDARGLELSRTEAAGTAQARAINTEWHADFRLPVRITEPGRITEFTYDGEGRLLSRVEREAP